MPQATIVTEAQEIEHLRHAFLDLIEECVDFASEVAEYEAEMGCMSLIAIQRHLQYLRNCADELKRPVQ